MLIEFYHGNISTISYSLDHVVIGNNGSKIQITQVGKSYFSSSSSFFVCDNILCCVGLIFIRIDQRFLLPRIKITCLLNFLLIIFLLRTPTWNRSFVLVKIKMDFILFSFSWFIHLRKLTLLISPLGIRESIMLMLVLFFLFCPPII